MNKLINFGKCDWYGNGRKINPIEVCVGLNERDGKPVFTARATVWNARRTKPVAGGQCLDSLKDELKDNKLFTEIYRLWESYHLNDLHAGTKEQEDAVTKWLVSGNIFEYSKACDYLKSIGLYEVEYEGKPYKYGTGWIYFEIKQEDLELMKKIIKDGEI